MVKIFLKESLKMMSCHNATQGSKLNTVIKKSIFFSDVNNSFLNDFLLTVGYWYPIPNIIQIN